MVTTTDPTPGATAPSRWRRLLHRGPSIDTLYADYASRRRIDPAASIVATAEVVVDAPATRVWDVLLDVEHWSAVDGRISHVDVDGEVAVGTRFKWRNGATRLSSRFAVVDPSHELTWTGVAIGARAVHRHIVTDLGDGRARLRTEESMSGAFLVLFFSREKLLAGLEAWLAAIARVAES